MLILQLELCLDTDTLTLQDLVDKVLKQRLGINEPTVGLGSTTIYEEGEGADERLEVNLVKLLKVGSVWVVDRTSCASLHVNRLEGWTHSSVPTTAGSSIFANQRFSHGLLLFL